MKEAVKKESSKKRKCWQMFLLVCFCSLIFSINVEAKNPTLKTLKLGKTYTKYDANGNKKADEIKVSALKTDKYGFSSIDALRVYVNGKRVGTLKPRGIAYNAEVKLITLKNRKVYFDIQAMGDNQDRTIYGIYQVKGGKLKKILNQQKAVKNVGYHIGYTTRKVKGNTITMRYNFMSYALGDFEADFTYKYKGGKLVLASKSGKIVSTRLNYLKKKYFTANRNFKIYKSANGTKTKFTLKKGEKVKFTKCYVGSRGCYYYLKTSKGKTGWLKSSKKMPYPDIPFEEVMYAG